MTDRMLSEQQTGCVGMRSLTVISGPGFRIKGQGIDLDARPFEPVAFRGDVAVAAESVLAPSEDFNAMVARALGAPQVWLAEGDLARGGRSSRPRAGGRQGVTSRRVT